MVEVTSLFLSINTINYTNVHSTSQDIRSPRLKKQSPVDERHIPSHSLADGGWNSPRGNLDTCGKQRVCSRMFSSSSKSRRSASNTWPNPKIYKDLTWILLLPHAASHPSQSTYGEPKYTEHLPLILNLAGSLALNRCELNSRNAERQGLVDIDVQNFGCPVVDKCGQGNKHQNDTIMIQFMYVMSWVEVVAKVAKERVDVAQWTLFQRDRDQLLKVEGIYSNYAFSKFEHFRTNYKYVKSESGN